MRSGAVERIRLLMSTFILKPTQSPFSFLMKWTLAISQRTQVIKRLFPEQPAETKPNPIPGGLVES